MNIDKGSNIRWISRKPNGCNIMCVKCNISVVQNGQRDKVT